MKRIVLWVLVGWGLAFLLSPRDVVGYFKKS
jgi:hypothetical protein